MIKNITKKDLIVVACLVGSGLLSGFVIRGCNSDNVSKEEYERDRKNVYKFIKANDKKHERQLRNLQKHYESIDTITTSNGANADLDDFIRRTDGHLPPGR